MYSVLRDFCQIGSKYHERSRNISPVSYFPQARVDFRHQTASVHCVPSVDVCRFTVTFFLPLHLNRTNRRTLFRCVSRCSYFCESTWFLSFCLSLSSLRVYALSPPPPPKFNVSRVLFWFSCMCELVLFGIPSFFFSLFFSTLAIFLRLPLMRYLRYLALNLTLGGFMSFYMLSVIYRRFNFGLGHRSVTIFSIGHS